jgi:hypothetical protein
MTLPAISISDLSTAHVVLSRTRYASPWCGEPSLMLFEQRFQTSQDTSTFLRISSVGSPTMTRGNGELRVQASAAATDTFLFEGRPKTSQFAVLADLKELSAGGSNSSFSVGVAITDTPTSDSFTDVIYAKLNRTEAAPNGSIELGYTKNGVLSYLAGPTLDQPLQFPLKFGFVMNQGSIALAVEENGVRRVLHNFDVNVANWDCQLESLIKRFKYFVRFDCDGVFDATITALLAYPMGSEGDREHALVRYENGEPWRNEEGLYAIVLDSIGPTTINTGVASYVSEYQRSQATVWLYNADTAHFVRPIAKISQRDNGRVFGAQEPRIIVDRTDGLYHIYVSNWNNIYDATYNPAGNTHQKIQHFATADDLLHGNHIIECQDVNLGNGIEFVTNVSTYQTDIRKVGGRYYITATRSDVSGRQVFVNWGTAHGSFTHHLWLDNSNGGAGLDEGGYFWDVGPHLYVVVGNGTTAVRVLNYSTGALVTTLGPFPGSGGYPGMNELLQHSKFGKTQFQMIGFSDPSFAEGFVSFDARLNPTAWPTIVNDLGTFDGEQFDGSRSVTVPIRIRGGVEISDS